MDGLDFSLRGFVVCYLLTYAAGILFAVLEGRRWNAAARTVPPAVVLIVFAPLIFPVVAHLVRPRLRARAIFVRKVAQIARNYYFCSLKSTSGRSLRPAEGAASETAGNKEFGFKRL